MKEKNIIWIEILVVFGLIVLVYVLCLPWGRSWTSEVTALYTGEEGVYARDPDSYYYIRKAREFTENGFSSISLFSEPKDALRTTNYSTGTNKTPLLLSASAAVAWYVLQLIGINVSIYFLATHFCSIILALCIVPIYVFLRKRSSIFASSCGAVLATIAKPIVTHSWQGVFDTDALIYFFALAIILSLLECAVSEKKGQRVAYGILSCVGTIGLFFTWEAYYIYVFIAIGAVIAGSLITSIIFRKDSISWRVPVLFSSILFLLVLVLGQDLRGMIEAILSPDSSGGKWPNPAKYITEMNRAGLFSGGNIWALFSSYRTDIISYFGGGIILVAFLLSFWLMVRSILIGVKGKKTCRPKAQESFLVSATISWTLMTIALIFFGIRFFEFLVAPIAIVIAYGINWMQSHINRMENSQLFTRTLSVICSVGVFGLFMITHPVMAVVLSALCLVLGFWRKVWGKPIFYIPLCILLLFGADVETLRIGGTSVVPDVCRPVESAMQWINKNTPEDAVLINDWTMGYAFQYYSHRRTLSDGGTYNGAFFYWLGTMYATDDINLAAGIARMLSANGLDATDYAVEVCGGKREAVNLMKTILPVSADEAREWLKKQTGYSTEQIDRLVDYTHPQTEELYFIVDAFSFRRASVAKATMEWDFETELKQKGDTLVGAHSIDYPKEGQEAVCQMGIGGTFSGWKAAVTQSNGKLLGEVITPSGVRLQCARFLYYKDGLQIEDVVHDNRGDSWIEQETFVIIEKNGRLSLVICEDSVVDSVIFRLYVLEDKDQNVFTQTFSDAIPESFSGESSLTQRMIGTEKTSRFSNCGIAIWKIN